MARKAKKSLEGEVVESPNQPVVPAENQTDLVEAVEEVVAPVEPEEPVVEPAEEAVEEEVVVEPEVKVEEPEEVLELSQNPDENLAARINAAAKKFPHRTQVVVGKLRTFVKCPDGSEYHIEEIPPRFL